MYKNVIPLSQSDFMLTPYPVINLVSAPIIPLSANPRRTHAITQSDTENEHISKNKVFTFGLEYCRIDKRKMMEYESNISVER